MMNRAICILMMTLYRSSITGAKILQINPVNNQRVIKGDFHPTTAV